MKTTNIEIRQAIDKSRLNYYEVAEALGISPGTFCVWLRKEFTPEKKEKTLKIIEELKKR